VLPSIRIYQSNLVVITKKNKMDIEKKPFPQIAKETVLAPLEMTNSTYEQPLPPDWLKRAAAGYRGDGSEVEGKRHIYPEWTNYGGNSSQHCHRISMGRLLAGTA
jgi:hypothetical protein